MDIPFYNVTGQIIAIGDIHGHCSLLKELIQKIEEKIDLGDPNNLLVFIGDYIDRGPENKATIEYLLQLKERIPNVVFLRGNHEDMFLDFIGHGGNFGDMHHYNGGNEVYKEYGIPEDSYKPLHDGTCRRLAEAEEFQSYFPKEHLDFIKSTQLAIQTEHFLFVHAGVAPKPSATFDVVNYYMPPRQEIRDKEWLSLEDQEDLDLLWIRQGFLGAEHKINKIVIHGHTPAREVYLN
jgi:serine/threonine protein phosphatase 1